MSSTALPLELVKVRVAQRVRILREKSLRTSPASLSWSALGSERASWKGRLRSLVEKSLRTSPASASLSWLGSEG
jgi:hypothetical protein